MKDDILRINYIQLDKTTLQVIADSDKKSKSKKYMCLYKSGEFRYLIIIYDYQKTREGSYSREFLNEFSDFIQTDIYTVCNKV